jgi:molybdopterin-guanine dinucleotide biosynthesis protein A
MGGGVKALLPVGGRPLAAWSAAALTPLCTRVVLATGTLGELPGLPWPGVADRFPGLGPVAGLHAGLVEAAGEGILVLPCDLPLVRTHHLAPLLAHRAGHDVVVYTHEGGIEPLVGWYGPGCGPVMARQLAAGGGPIRATWGLLRVLELPWLFPRELLRNVNTPAERAEAEAQLRDCQGRVGPTAGS